MLLEKLLGFRTNPVRQQRDTTEVLLLGKLEDMVEQFGAGAYPFENRMPSAAKRARLGVW